jgi:hypothetical protein
MMLITKLGIALLLALAAVRPCFADDRERLIGIWEVVSYEMVLPTTGERQKVRGEHPSGYLIFTPEGRMSGLLTNEGRKPAKTDQDRADLFLSMVAYTGKYRVEGEKWITTVDVAANPAMVGTEQERSFRLEGDQLQETTPLMQWAPHPEIGMVRFVITYRRAG